MTAGKAFDDYIEAKGNGIACSSEDRAPQFVRRQDARDFINEFHRTEENIMALWWPEVLASLRTRYISPTNDRGPDISARRDGLGGSRYITAPWDSDLGVAGNHAKAAQMWLEKFNANTKVRYPGLGFNGDFYWTWDHNQEEESK